MSKDVVTATAAEIESASLPQTVRSAYRDFTELVRKHPFETIATVAAVGFVVGLAAYSAKPDPTLRERFSSLLSEFEGRIRDHAQAARRQAGSLAEDGFSSAQDAYSSAESGVKRLADDAVTRFRRLFS